MKNQRASSANVGQPLLMKPQRQGSAKARSRANNAATRNTKPLQPATNNEGFTSNGNEVKQGRLASTGRKTVQPVATRREGFGLRGKKVNKRRGKQRKPPYCTCRPLRSTQIYPIQGCDATRSEDEKGGSGSAVGEGFTSDGDEKGDKIFGGAEALTTGGEGLATDGDEVKQGPLASADTSPQPRRTAPPEERAAETDARDFRRYFSGLSYFSSMQLAEKRFGLLGKASKLGFHLSYIF
uniref:Uncharacterized protein n=1 Tax=Ananas comosus var. bracteatus TaxID=296719 RepID=A0A6V7PHH1_ANACO|nr:unnamed protein product [Ananas comosus var. bracteatus]